MREQLRWNNNVSFAEYTTDFFLNLMHTDLISDSKLVRMGGLPPLAPEGAGGSHGEMEGSLLVPAASGHSEQVSWLRALAPSVPLRHTAQKVAPRGQYCSVENAHAVMPWRVGAAWAS